jgi:hypothetical protein
MGELERHAIKKGGPAYLDFGNRNFKRPFWLGEKGSTNPGRGQFADSAV